MPPYLVMCIGAGCAAPAPFKIAAEWNAGATRELKTYSLCCAGCVAEHFLAAGRKQRVCRLTPGETLDPPGVYELVFGVAERGLVRRSDLEV